MKRNAILSTLALALFAPTFACAHPQYAGGGFLPGFVHPLLGLDHLLAMITLGAWAAQMGARAMWSVPTAFVAAMASGGLLGAAGISFPFVEPMLAATVLMLGLFVMLDTRVPLAYGIALAAGFALFHAAAHVEEAPASSSLFAYGAGFVLATALLHLSGVMTAWTVRRRVEVLRFAGAPIALAGAWMLFSRLS